MLVGCGGGDPAPKGPFAITFKDYDNTVLESKMWEANQVPSYNYTVKEDTAEWKYTFKGWSETLNGSVITIPPASKDATYYAVVDQTKQKYTVTFVTNGGSSISPVTQDYGTSVSKPQNPTKSGYTFLAWYLDSALTEEATFPFTLTKNVTLYAKYTSPKDAFLSARKNTIGDQVPGYEYDYTLNITLGYMSALLTGNTDGNTKYNALSQDVSFNDEHTNSGVLFYDGSKYTFKKGNDLHEVSVDEDGVVKKYNITQVGDDYKYDTSSFAKAIFEYSDDQIKKVEPTATPNEYKLETGFNASKAISLIGNYINHPIVEKLIGQLPETSVQTDMYVSFANDKLISYRYLMDINVTGISLTLIYSLSFKNVGVAPTITPKVFNNTYVTNSDVTRVKSEINGYINAYKALERSSYDFKAKTAVDYPHKNAINATVDGFTKRKVSSGNVYYLNDYEVDTDHKNADLYKAKGLGDCHGGRAKLSTGVVHDLKKKLLGGYNDLGVVSHENIDNFYLMDILELIGTPTFIQKIPNDKEGTITYSIGASLDGEKNVLKSFNDNLRLNAIKECSVDVKAFGDYEVSSIVVKEFVFKITISGNAFTKIEMKMNGSMNTSFPNSRDFTTKQSAGFDLKFDLDVTNDAKNFEPAAEVKDI